MLFDVNSPDGSDDDHAVKKQWIGLELSLDKTVFNGEKLMELIVIKMYLIEAWYRRFGSKRMVCVNELKDPHKFDPEWEHPGKCRLALLTIVKLFWFSLSNITDNSYGNR